MDEDSKHCSPPIPIMAAHQMDTQKLFLPISHGLLTLCEMFYTCFFLCELQFQLHQNHSTGQAVPRGFGSVCLEAVQTVFNE